MNKYSKWYPFPLKIAGVGRYVPNRVIKSKELEAQCGFPGGWCSEHLGVLERRWVEDETQSFMGAQAAREAIADANTDLYDIDLIINASMSFERKIPDGGPLIQRQLGLEESGIPCTTVQASCLSFLAALDVSASLLAVGTCRNILMVSAEVVSPILDTHYPEAYTLFGDGAAAAVITLASPRENSCIHHALLETYGRGVPWMQSLYGFTALQNKMEHPKDIALQMDMKAFMEHGIDYTRKLLGKLCKTLHINNSDIKLVIPQQAGKALLDNLQQDIPAERIIRIIDRFGFCGAASFPMALYEAIKTDKLKRKDLFLLVGFGPGLSVGGMIMTY